MGARKHLTCMPTIAHTYTAYRYDWRDVVIAKYDVRGLRNGRWKRFSNLWGEEKSGWATRAKLFMNSILSRCVCSLCDKTIACRHVGKTWERDNVTTYGRYVTWSLKPHLHSTSSRHRQIHRSKRSASLRRPPTSHTIGMFTIHKKKKKMNNTFNFIG